MQIFFEFGAEIIKDKPKSRKFKKIWDLLGLAFLIKNFWIY